MRPTLSPLFTGHKMRIAFDMIDNKSERFVDHVRASAGGALELDMKDVFNRYATNVIASFAFGLDVHSMEQRDNEFFTMAKMVNHFDGPRCLALVLCMSWPAMAKLLGGKCRTYFTQMAMNVMRHRRETGIVRADLIDLLMKLNDGENQAGNQLGVFPEVFSNACENGHRSL